MQNRGALKQAVLDGLRSRNAKPGETVEWGWFWFQVCEGRQGIDVETLDFQEMASFTRDFRLVEKIDAQQTHVLNELKVEPLRCTLRHYARVDTYYEPGDPEAFLSRISPAEEDFSGWVVGTRSQGLPINNLRGHDRISLYEVSIHDRRFFPFWLLPEGWSVVFENDRPVPVPPGESDRYFVTDHSPSRPWWKFWG